MCFQILGKSHFVSDQLQKPVNYSYGTTTNITTKTLASTSTCLELPLTWNPVRADFLWCGDDNGALASFTKGAIRDCKKAAANGACGKLTAGAPRSE